MRRWALNSGLTRENNPKRQCVCAIDPPLPQSVIGFRGAAAAAVAAAAGAFTLGAVAVACATVAASVALRMVEAAGAGSLGLIGLRISATSNTLCRDCRMHCSMATMSPGVHDSSGAVAVTAAAAKGGVSFHDGGCFEKGKGKKVR